ncbi:MAG: hypothetical protein LBM09_02780 [Candidatus Nomurabacteria bacterium]|jgi:cyclopropane fatty-acyl-phospholipid synthase-like methyltransferase|nr:hypothetical protein [Candidatus Nomurabacteria bacterium]
MTVFWAICLAIIVVVGIGVLCGGAPFVPTRKKWINDALDLAKIKPDDVIVDLGSGNGEVLKMAIKCGAKRAVGYEVNPFLVWWSRVRLRKFDDKIEVKNSDFFRTNLPSDTTIIYLFQVDKVLRKIPDFLMQQKSKLQTKKLRVIVFGFQIPDKKPIREQNGMKIYEF